MIVIYLVTAAITMNCCTGFIITKKQDVIIKQNYSYVQHTPKTSFKKIIKVKLDVHAIDMLKNRLRETAQDQSQNSIYELISILSTERINKNTSDKTEKFDIQEIIPEHNLNYDFLVQNQTGLEPDEVFYIAIDGLSNMDRKQTRLLLSFPKVIQKITIGEDLNRTQSNKTLDFPLIPDCNVGAENCTKCKEISPYCHYMYSEKRCVYFGTYHASRLYECGKRWFVVDEHMPFFITLTLVLVISSALGGYMILLRMKLMYNLDEIDTTEYEALRSAVEKIRQRRLPDSTADDTHLNPNDTQSDSK